VKSELKRLNEQMKSLDDSISVREYSSAVRIPGPCRSFSNSQDRPIGCRRSIGQRAFFDGLIRAVGIVSPLDVITWGGFVLATNRGFEKTFLKSSDFFPLCMGFAF
jgi:hypothetical protein